MQMVYDVIWETIQKNFPDVRCGLPLECVTLSRCTPNALPEEPSGLPANLRLPQPTIGVTALATLAVAAHTERSVLLFLGALSWWVMPFVVVADMSARKSWPRSHCASHGMTCMCLSRSMVWL
jgi:hypothetical protein